MGTERLKLCVQILGLVHRVDELVEPFAGVVVRIDIPNPNRILGSQELGRQHEAVVMPLRL